MYTYDPYQYIILINIIIEYICEIVRVFLSLTNSLEFYP